MGGARAPLTSKKVPMETSVLFSLSSHLKGFIKGFLKVDSSFRASLNEMLGVNLN